MLTVYLLPNTIYALMGHLIRTKRSGHHFVPKKYLLDGSQHMTGAEVLICLSACEDFSKTTMHEDKAVEYYDGPLASN